MTTPTPVSPGSHKRFLFDTGDSDLVLTKETAQSAGLMRPIIERSDRDGLPCHLETADPANVAFYRRFGFEVERSSTSPSRSYPAAAPP
jgi:hypothetical protein